MNSKTLLILAAFPALVFCGWGTVRIVKGIDFTQNCGGYLKRAANANTVDLAARELGRAVEYIERNNITSGYTSVLWRTPDEDVGYWRDNLTASLNELREIKSDASPLERSNVLMKLRETLTDQGEKGTNLTVPDGISIFPSNVAFFIWGGLSSMLAAVLAGAAMVKYDWY